MLNVIAHGAPADAPPLLIAHGLFGSGRNWGVIAKRLADRRQVLAVDMRNHGHSPWFDSHGYEEMAADLAEVLEEHGPADVLGHSMGGKAAMVLALTRPELVNRLIVVDVAPVAYSHSQIRNIQAMRHVDLSRVTRRSDAEAQLAEVLDDPTLRSFFTQSLDPAERRWRFNLDALEAEMPRILSFPDIEGRYDGPVLMVAGGTSDYIRPDHRPAIRALFPEAVFVKIPGAGHWVHAERPSAFVALVAEWLGRPQDGAASGGA